MDKIVFEDHFDERGRAKINELIFYLLVDIFSHIAGNWGTRFICLPKIKRQSDFLTSMRAFSWIYPGIGSGKIILGRSANNWRNFNKCLASNRKSFCLAIFYGVHEEERNKDLTLANSSTISAMDRYSIFGIISINLAKKRRISISTAMSFLTCGWMSFTATCCFFPFGRWRVPRYTWAIQPEPIGFSSIVSRSLQSGPKVLVRVLLAILHGYV